MTPELERLIKSAADKAGWLFNKDGELHALYHAVKSDGTDVVFRPPDLPKDLMTAMVRKAFEALDVVRYIFMDEAWVLIKTDVTEAEKEMMKRDGVRSHPDCIEVIMIVGEDINGVYMAQRRITRLPDGKAVLGPLQIQDFDGAEGRLVGLLPKPKGARLQ